MQETEKTILLVEDEVLLAMDESYTLQDYGYQVILAHTGEDAIEKINAEEKIDLILMDIDLGPGIDGTEAAAQILEKRSIPIIFLSFHQEKDVVAKTEGITSYGYILKSAPETVLIAGIKMAFRLHEAKQRAKAISEEKARIAQEWQNTFDSSNDAIWILDENQKILRVNKTAEDLFAKLSSEMVGRRCYEVIHKYQKPIVACPFNKVVDTIKREELELTMGDRCFQVVVDPIINDQKQLIGAVHTLSDITARKQSEAELKYQNGLQKVLMNISTKYINLELSDIDTAINNSLKDLGTFVEADRAYIFHYDWNKEVCRNTHLWCSENITTKFDYLDEMAFDQMAQRVEKHKKNKILYIKNIEELVGSDPLSKNIEPQQIKSNITIPIMDGNSCLGFVGFDSIKEDHTYSEKEIQLLKLFAQIISNVENRQSTEKKLKASESRYRTIFNSTGTVTLLVNNNTYIEMANKEAKNVTGFTADELIGSKWTDHVAPQGLKMMQQFHEIRRTNQGEAPNKYEVDLIHKSGEIRRTLLTIGMIPDSELSLVTLIDITQRYQATEKLREHKTKLSSIFRAAPIGIGLLSQRKLLEVNDYLCKLLNYSKEELIGQNARILYPSKKDYDYVGREKYRQIAENGTGTVQTRFQTKSGEVLDVLLSSTPININDLAAGVTFTVLDITEQKKAETEINLLADSLKNINECVSITDLDDKLIFVNDSFLQTYGYSREELLGENITLVDSAQNSPQLIDEIMPATLKGGWSGELWNKRKDGSEFPISLSTKIIYDQQDKPIALIGVAKDISQQKQAEAELQKQYSLLKIAGETAKFGGWDVDLKTNVSHWSDVVAAIHEEPPGFDPQVEDGINYYAPEWREKITELFQACAQEGIPYDEEMQIITAKGKRKWIRTIGRAVRDKNNQITMVTGSFQDITERKSAEEALRASEEKYRRIADNVTDVVWVIDLEMNPTYISPSVERVFGIKPQAYLKLPLTETYPPASLEKFQKKLAEEFAKEQDPQADKNRVFHLEVERYYRDGSIAWDTISASFVRDEEGRPIAIQGVSHDITQTKQAQEELRRNQENLAITLDSIGDGVISTNIEGEIVNMNPVAEKLCGWQKKQALGQQLSEVFKIHDSESGEQIADPVKKVIDNGEVVGLANHTVLLSRDGKEYPIADSAAPIKNGSGEILGVVLVFSDFSEKYANQKKLAESEERFKALHNASFGGITIHDKGLIMECNQGLSDITGYSYEELIGMDGLLLIAEETRDLVMNNILAGYEEVYEAIGLRKNGEKYPLQLEARNIHYKGKLVRTVEFRDITERKKAEEQIIESEITFRKLFEESSDPILLINKEDVFVECNQATLDLLGMTRDQFISLTPADISPEFQPDGSLSKLAAQDMINLAYQNGTHRFDWTHINAAGEEFIVEISLMPIVLHGETMLHTTWRNITERKQYEAKIKQLLQEKEILLREVHHRVKNNLGVVQSMLSLQAISLKDKRSKNVLKEAAGRLQSMLLLYNKLYRSELKRDLSLQVFLPPLINEIVDNFKEIVSIEPDLEIADIDLDPKILVPVGIIINEFITNSVKYSFEAKQNGKIVIKANKKDNMVRLTYADGTAMVDPKLFANSDTFGLKLIQLMIKQIRGKIAIEEGNCTMYVIEFSIRK